MFGLRGIPVGSALSARRLKRATTGTQPVATPTSTLDAEPPSRRADGSIDSGLYIDRGHDLRSQAAYGLLRWLSRRGR